MLGKLHRLATQDIPIVARKGVRAKSDLITLSYFTSNTESKKFCFVVSTKIDKRATQRNRIKRRLRAATHQILPTLPNGMYMVIANSQELANCEFPLIVNTLVRLISQVGK